MPLVYSFSSQGAEEVQLQTWGGNAEAYAKVGLELANIDPRVVVWNHSVFFQTNARQKVGRSVFP